MHTQTTRTFPIDPPAHVCQAPLFELLRCHCRQCLQLDRAHTGEGYQLSLLRWVELGFQA